MRLIGAFKYFMEETIIALATPPLKSALALIRLSGKDCFEIVSKVFSKDLRGLKKRDVFVGQIKAGDKIIDDVVLNAYKGPRSFTGEDSVEIICHGSMLIANQIIKEILSKGARLATNGEFSQRAFLNNKIDLVQAEAINDVINAINDEAKQISMLSLKGDTSNIVLAIRNRIADILSLIEVNIDFPEYEDIEEASKEMIINYVNEVTDKVGNLLNEGEKAQIIRDGLKVAIVGKPNVGKSSLLNALLQEDKAIVTEIPGTTRDVVEGQVNLGGIPLNLFDTAGIRETNDVIESIGINKSVKAIEDADLVIAVIDASRGLDEEDKQILEKIKDRKHIVVYNKADLVNDKDNHIYVSAANNDLESLKKEIYRLFDINETTFKTPALNNSRQLGLLRKAIDELKKAKIDAENDLSTDLIAVSLHQAYSCLSEILGEDSLTDFTKEIFSRFCVGK
ncbi:MAG: tRNA uridine-5-carboxymethylaminomethyl(34) synthesis GTPase MnmE [Erysipelotrichaceae bacterium]|nr:tRNA uridine-5-carboxymethylaminomethyl(34) synthesis GTPase MnmE [Erysipelotrichaceae bacterium]